MRVVEPQVFLIARPSLDVEAIGKYLQEVGGQAWGERTFQDSSGVDAQRLIEFAGKLCYRAWEPGLNVNVRQVREDSDRYLANILHSGHGSVLEHAQFSFVFHNVSRVFTHELVRHRAGVGISQESLRFVRLTDIPVWMPPWAEEDPRIVEQVAGLVEQMEQFQLFMADRYGLDEPDAPFHHKKHVTSFMRRFAPDGVATGIVWSANVRTLRWVVEARTDPAAEEEIRLVFGQVAELMRTEAPLLFSDFTNTDGHWQPQHRKV